MTIKRRFMLFFGIVMLAGCGSGGGGDLALGPGPTPNPAPDPGTDPGLDTGIGGSGGRVVGTFQGLGSILINDRTLTTDNAEFEIEDGADETDLREGQRLLVFADLAASEADRVVYRSDVKGPITAVSNVDLVTGSAGLQVLGQPVVTNSLTRFRGATLASLTVGNLVEVSGAWNADGALVATFVELKGALSEYQAVGRIRNLDVGGTRFDLRSLRVDYGSASLSEFEGSAIAADQIVEVRLDPADFATPNDAVAREIELLTAPPFADGEQVEYEGFIDRFVSAVDFSIEGLAVTTGSGTGFVNGNSGSLGRNVKVEAEGTIDADGVLVADRIVIKPTGAVRVEGTVSAVDIDAGTVTMAVGVTFEIRTLTRLEDDRDDIEPFTLAHIQTGPNGDYLEVRGFLDGETVVAGELERDDFDSRTRLRGPVTAEDEVAGTVDILGIEVRGVAGVTSYPVSQLQFHSLVEIGTFVEAKWDPFISTAGTADELSIEDD